MVFKNVSLCIKQPSLINGKSLAITQSPKSLGLGLKVTDAHPELIVVIGALAHCDLTHLLRFHIVAIIFPFPNTHPQVL